jgi:polysaccharide biosynthesis/export protein
MAVRGPAVGFLVAAVLFAGVAPEEYQIGEGDVLQISVGAEPAASLPRVVVRPDGKLSMPLLRDVRVAGPTPAQAEKAITDGFADSIKSANVTVMVSEINSNKVYLLGAVKKGGQIPFNYRMTMVETLSEAGVSRTLPSERRSMSCTTKTERSPGCHSITTPW